MTIARVVKWFLVVKYASASKGVTDANNLRLAEAKLSTIISLPRSGQLEWVASLPTKEQREARKLIGLEVLEYSADTFLRYIARAQEDNAFYKSEGGTLIAAKLYPFVDSWKQDDPESYYAFTKLFTSDRQTLQSICDARYNGWFDADMMLFKDDCRGVVSKQVGWLGSNLETGVANVKNAMKTAKNAMSYFNR